MNHRYLLPLLAILLLYACGGEAIGRRSAGAMDENQTAELVQGTCGSCHLMPQPDDLPYGIWDTVVLPRMARFLGRYATPAERSTILAAERLSGTGEHFYPPEPLINDEDWATIRVYYLSQAPKALRPTGFESAAPTDYFRVRFPNLFLSPPSTTFVGMSGKGEFLLADVNKESLFLLDEALRPVATFPIGRGLTAATGFMAGDVATVIGSFSPTETGNGSLIQFTSRGARPLATGLQRPTSLVRLDTDADGQEEIIVTEYGKWTGRLSLWRQVGNDEYLAETLEERSGALAVIHDTTAVRPTVYVLFGQGKEEIVRYIFDQGKVRRAVIRQFPPSFGSSSLQMTDWNKDGLPDLLYTNGDNADYRSPVKPYHGIRLFLGKRNGTFTDGPFIPYPGAYGAEVTDFNEDGLPDIAAISFFPDYSIPEPAGAVLFHQQADGEFMAAPLPFGDKHRYLTIHAADYDNDGDTDLIAGCLAMEPVPDNGRLGRWLQQGMPAVVWENELAR